MNFVVWNCNMAFRRKCGHLLPFAPDIAVVTECEHPDRLCEALQIEPYQVLWTGDNRHKGLAVVALNGDYAIKRLGEDFDSGIRYALPVAVEGPVSFNLLAVWAMDDQKDRSRRYIGQVWAALNQYEELLRAPCIVAGDFNGNVIWDTASRAVNFAHVAEFLHERGLRSAYHAQTGEAFGEELTPTLYMYRRPTPTYHIDYAFLCESLLSRLTGFQVGPAETWLSQSDHVPLFLSLRDDVPASP